MRFISTSVKKTHELAKLLARKFKKTLKKDHAMVIALQGNLGSGKTTFVKGFARALGAHNRITSPTFIIFRSHKLRNAPHTHLFHMDAYRLKATKDLHALDFKNILKNPKHIILIEWAENIKRALPKHTHWISFDYGKKKNERVISIK